jgi:hypothetical protein
VSFNAKMLKGPRGWRDTPLVARELMTAYRPAGIARRARYEAELRTGAMRLRLPAHEAGLPQAPPGGPRLPPFDIDALRAGYARLPDADSVREQIVDEAERLLVSGELRMFGGDFAYVGWPPAWRRHPHTGFEHPREVHWSQVSDHNVAAGDIKDVWEPSRFSWAYLLARAYVVSGDDRYPEAFWTALEHWIADNPWNCGPNWRCAQESSLRAIAVFFASRAFAHHPSSTFERQCVVNRLLHVTGRRVATTIHYAASQRNNHLISEASFLSLLAIIYPDWPETPRWGRRGWRHLMRGIADQFYPDGSYAQHSFTYQRFSTQMLCWLLTVRRWCGLSEPPHIIDAVRRSLRLLYAVQDERSGYVPNFGSNDGGLPLLLSTCTFRDFRPTLQIASILVNDHRLYPLGPWDEEALWFCGSPELEAETGRGVRPGRIVAPDGGLLVSRGNEAMALLRFAPTWRHRPGHADDGHVDVWLGGTEVAGDAGTYRYTGPSPWDNRLASSCVHNTITIGGDDRCHRLGRFLSTGWPETRVLLDASGVNWQCWVVDFHVVAWRRKGGRHRRLLLRAMDTVLVADRVGVDSPHEARLHWNLPIDGDLAVTPAGCRLAGKGWVVRLMAYEDTLAEETIGGEGPAGWRSPTYGVLNERRTLSLALPTGEASLVLSVFTKPCDPMRYQGLVDRARDLLNEPSKKKASGLGCLVR